MLYVPKESFGSGEIAPVAEGLGSSPVFQNGCKTLTNAVLTRYGGARRRPGSRYVCRTVADHPAILIPYEPTDGTRYLVQISSKAGTDPIKYQYLTVLNQFTAASASDTKDGELVDFADGTAKAYLVDRTTDPIGSSPSAAPGSSPPSGAGLTSSNCYFHPYLEEDLPEIQWVQYENILVLLHEDHPPFFLEKGVDQDEADEWRYGLLSERIRTMSPEVLRRTTSITMTLDEPSSGKFTCNIPYFTKGHEGIWRLDGETADPDAHPWGNWYATTAYISPTEMTCTGEITGAGTGATKDPTDWAGPWIDFGSNSTATLAGNTGQYEEGSFTITAGTTLDADYNGSVIVIGSDTLFVTEVLGATTFTAVKLNSGILAAASGLTVEWHRLGGDPDTVADDPGFTHPLIWYKASAGEVIEVVNPDYNEPLVSDVLTGTTANFDQVSVGGAIMFLNGYLHSGASLETPGGSTGDFIVRIMQAQSGGDVQLVPSSRYPTQKYAIGWSRAAGFPTTGTVHQDRLFLGGFSGEAGNVVIASRTGDPYTWDYEADADDALTFSLKLADGEQVRWFASSTDLLMGTDETEYKISGSPITPSEIGVDRQSSYGADLVRPAFVAGAAIFVQRGSAGVREMLFDFGRDRYLANDLTDAASHLFGNANQIQHLVYSASPHQLILARTDKRKLYACTYRRENGVIGWSYWDFTWADDDAGYGGCEWVTSLKAFDGNDPDTSESMGKQDNVYCVVKGQDDSRFIVAIGEPYTADCQSYASAFDETSLDGFDHFVSMEDLQVVADDVYVGDFDADGSGSIDWTSVGFTSGTVPTDAYVGFGFTFELVPTIPYVADRNGSTAGRLQSVVDARVLFCNCTQGVIIEGTNFQTVPGAIPSQAVPMLEGWTQVEAVGEHGENNELSISQTAPYYIEVGGINFGLQHSS